MGEEKFLFLVLPIHRKSIRNRVACLLSGPCEIKKLVITKRSSPASKSQFLTLKLLLEIFGLTSNLYKIFPALSDSHPS